MSSKDIVLPNKNPVVDSVMSGKEHDCCCSKKERALGQVAPQRKQKREVDGIISDEPNEPQECCCNKKERS